jgi:hypothetical protein
VLDLGGYDGDHVTTLLGLRVRLTVVADIDTGGFQTARRRGYAPVRVDATKPLPFPDKAFDLVICSSTLEHVTGPRELVLRTTDKSTFEQMAARYQCSLAEEIRRVGKAYYVQVPYKWFPIETHTWLPVVYLFASRSWQMALVAWTNGWWLKETELDFRLLTTRSMRVLLPEAHVRFERWLGLPKSIMALRAGDEPDVPEAEHTPRGDAAPVSD